MQQGLACQLQTQVGPMREPWQVLLPLLNELVPSLIFHL